MEVPAADPFNLPSIRSHQDQMMSLADYSDLKLEEEHGKLLEPSYSTENKTIICVDDNFVNLSSFRLQFEMMGFKGEFNGFQGCQATIDFIYDFLY